MAKEKLNNSEYKIMDIIWDHGGGQEEPLMAKDITAQAHARYGWNKNTTYTILTGLAKKGVIRREEPNFLCFPLLTRAQAQRQETHTLIDKLFQGSAKLFFSSFLEEEPLTQEEIEELEAMIQKKKQ